MSDVKTEAGSLDDLYPDEPVTGIYKSVPMECLPDNWNLLSPDPDKSLVRSVKKVGILQPVVLRARLEEDPIYGTRIVLPYEVVAGRRRIKAARLCGMQEIPAMVYPDTYGSMEVLALVENAERSPNQPMELDYLQRLMRKGYSDKEVAQLTGMSVGTIRKRMRLSGLSHELTRRWEAGEIASGVAQEAARLSPAQQLDLEGEATITSAHIHQLRQAAMKDVLQQMPTRLIGLTGEGSTPVSRRAFRIGSLVEQIKGLLVPADPPEIPEAIALIEDRLGDLAHVMSEEAEG